MKTEEQTVIPTPVTRASTVALLLWGCAPTSSAPPVADPQPWEVDVQIAVVYDTLAAAVRPVRVGPNPVDLLAQFTFTRGQDSCVASLRWSEGTFPDEAAEGMWSSWSLPVSLANRSHDCENVGEVDATLDRLLGETVRVGVGPYTREPAADGLSEEHQEQILGALLELGGETGEPLPYAFAVPLGRDFVPEGGDFLRASDVFGRGSVAQAQFIISDARRWLVPDDDGVFTSTDRGVVLPEFGYALPGADAERFAASILIGAFGQVREGPQLAREYVVGRGTPMCPAMLGASEVGECEGNDGTWFSGAVSAEQDVFVSFRSWGPRHDLTIDGSWGPCDDQLDPTGPPSQCAPRLEWVDRYASTVLPSRLLAEEYRFDLISDGEIDLHRFTGSVRVDDYLEVSGILELAKLRGQEVLADGQGEMDLLIDGVRYTSEFVQVAGAPGCVEVEIDGAADALCLFQ